ncbi:hypothetical protein CCMA1212_002304 [Trichoderma ghanense]|uniref:Uncharacterized protein n=1 Tax=Trichoderma ghanense TaxID=65468 RepID=A0ABY2HEC9_9HYPO
MTLATERGETGGTVWLTAPSRAESGRVRGFVAAMPQLQMTEGDEKKGKEKQKQKKDNRTTMATLLVGGLEARTGRGFHLEEADAKRSNGSWEHVPSSPAAIQ